MVVKQTVGSQKGEVEFRRKLYQQQVDGQEIFSDEFDVEGIKNILTTRMLATREQIGGLRQSGLTISPYLEIGAERGQWSLVMENDLQASGIAADLSFDMLKSADYYSKVFNKSKIPLRVCCDVNNLPFLSNSIPFVFCYDTLHHFPDPTPVIAEIKRVLAPGASFFFGQEPYKKIFHVNLYKGTKVYSRRALNFGKLKKIIDYFLAARIGNELDYGIIENEEIHIGHWKRALNIFPEKNIQLQSLGRITTTLYGQKNYLKYFLNYLLGGNIFGTVRKPGEMVDFGLKREDFFICPNCLKAGQEVKLCQEESSWLCSHCNTVFPVVDSVVFLLADDKLAELYPEIYSNRPAKIKVSVKNI